MQRTISQACEICDSILNNFLLPEILRQIDEELSITHMKLSVGCERILMDPNNKTRRWKLPKDVCM